MKINNYTCISKFYRSRRVLFIEQTQMRTECRQIIVGYMKKGINILIFIPYSLGPICEFSHGWGLVGFFQCYNQAV